jgi:hypothetical protein
MLQMCEKLDYGVERGTVQYWISICVQEVRRVQLETNNEDSKR